MTRRDKVRRGEIRRVLNVESHLLGIERAQISMYLFRPCVQNSPTKARQVQLAKPTEKRFKGHPRPRCSDLAWARVGVESAEISEIAVDREVFQALLGLLPPGPSLEEKRA